MASLKGQPKRKHTPTTNDDTKWQFLPYLLYVCMHKQTYLCIHIWGVRYLCFFPSYLINQYYLIYISDLKLQDKNRK